MKDFLGFESPIKSITLDQYFGSIRPEDREPVRRAVEHTKRHGSDAEVIYEETFHDGVKLLLFTRWVPERDAEGKMVRFRGLSIDITRVRHAHDRELRKERIHADTGLAEKEMAEERLAYLTTRAVRFGKPFSSIGICIKNYPDVKRRLADDALYNQTHTSIARLLLDTIPDLDTLARLGRGRFLAILSRTATPSDIDQATKIVTEGWQNALQQSDTTQVDPVSTTTAVIHCPENGTEWMGLLALLEKQLET
jgi:GGDEF domain-containing protein